MRNLGGGPPATSRHMSRLLRLLPSRPDRVHRVSLREDQKPTIENRIQSKVIRPCLSAGRIMTIWLRVFNPLKKISLRQ